MPTALSGGHPARKLVRLSCGHQRKILKPSMEKSYYCLECDEHERTVVEMLDRRLW